MEGIKDWQSRNRLKVDGFLNSAGETIRPMRKSMDIRAEDPVAVPRRRLPFQGPEDTARACHSRAARQQT